MANIPKFCKIFIQTKDNFIRIPRDFEERYGRDLPIDVCLEVPGGMLWEVELLYNLTFELLITKGWVEFRDHYSIAEGYSLVFGYNGDSRLHVHIFDLMGTEIKYRVSTSSTGADHGPNVPPRFFKIILDSKLRIPKKFTDMYGADLPDEVFLKVPNGKSCKVELNRDEDGEIWMVNGWEEFKDHHSISLGQTLVFQYDGVSHEFEVWIFDMNAVEIDYMHAGDRADVGGGSNIGLSMYFETEIKPHNRYTITLPKDFTYANRIKKGMDVILENVEGKRWSVRVVSKDDRWGESEQYALCSGFNDFLVDNDVAVGATMSFRMVSRSHKLIETRVLENGECSKELIKYVKRKGGRYAVDTYKRLRLSRKFGKK